jgi:hypothetical protein
MRAAMKLLKKYRLALIAAMLMAVGGTSCVNYYGYTSDDDEWTNGDYNSENLLLNGEVEIDDYDR